MAGGCGFNVYISICVIFSLVGLSLSYIELNLENGKVCSTVRKREVSLGENENSAISLKELRYFDKWSGAFPFYCALTVTAPWGYGIIAVIQNLDFRQNETTSECIDYVQFQRQKRKLSFISWDSVQSPKYCGIVNSIHDADAFDGDDDDEDDHDSPKFQMAHNAFIDEKGRLDVIISVAGQRLLPSQKLDISIIFTAYKTCRSGDQAGLKECHKGSGICIWEGFFHDKNVNCPDDGCFDEGGCPVISPGGKRQSSGLGTKVTIGAVVLILGLLLLFMLCLFVCRRCQVLCWSGPPAPRPQRAGQQTSRVEMTAPSGNAGILDGHSPPSAPPLLPVTSATSPVHEDKDLPPPYESLFPTR
ncbi:hypothetical protein ONE63_000455 [Megalurothrips usitatus]|uniref:Uncharacterized protein n=1 Tax=Megalurothrips usitatus TaxID=439358 RepID=A0AAV7XZ27_9NEOP|nr:hypothetical protein ONE63_000455 [Megalurothrips usitatus]